MAGRSVRLHYTPLPPSRFTLDRLPSELISAIFEQLYQPRDIARLRLVCKLFAEIGSFHLLSEVQLFNKSSQFDQFRQISEHPIISKKVDTLFYEADFLLKNDTMQDWKDDACASGWITPSPAERLQPPLPTASAREQRAYNRSLNKSMRGPEYTEKLLWEYDRYKGYLAEQESIRLQEYNMELLKEAMAKMPNIKTIKMSTQCCIYNGRSAEMVHAFENGLSAPYGDLQAEEGSGVGQLRALLLAADAVGLKFETLAAGRLDWRFFRESSKQNADVLERVQRSVRSLRTLRLYILTHAKADDGVAPDHLNHGTPLPESSRHFHQTFHLKGFITATPDLERLDITFDSDFGSSPPVALCHCIDASFTWPSLRVAALESVSADEDCLVHFLARHATTLRKLRLASILLVTGSWQSFFQRARDTFQGSSLEQVALSGRFCSTDPKEAFWFDLPPGLNSGMRAQIEVCVEKYLLGTLNIPDLQFDLRAWYGAVLGAYVYTESFDLPRFIDKDSDRFIMDRFC